MNPIQAFNHSDGTMTIVVTEHAQINWLRFMGVSEEFLKTGEHHLPSEERRKVYPTLSEAIEPTLTRLLDARKKLTDSLP